MAKAEPQIIGAWHPAANAIRGKTGMMIVYMTDLGTAHAGDLRKSWRVPEKVVADVPVVSKIVESSFKLHRLLTCGDDELAAAFERLLKEPSFSKLGLNEWEFRLAADAPGAFLKWGSFTWKQRKYLREIVKKVLGE